MQSGRELLKNMKFGFEFETLVETNERDFNSALAALNKTTHNLDEKYGDIDEEKEYKDTANQLIIAAHMNLMNKAFYFKVASDYHGLEVDVPSLEALVGKLGLSTTARARANLEKTTNQFWVVTRDSSVDHNRYKHRPNLYQTLKDMNEDRYREDRTKIIHHIEIVSPILTMKDVTENIIGTFINKVAPANDTFMYWNNRTTSNHIHLSCGDLFKQPANLVKICMAWWWCEPLFMLLCGYWRRDNIYAVGIRRKKASSTKVFRNLNDTNYKTFFKVNAAAAVDNPDEAMRVAIVTYFQGDFSDNEALHLTRRAALNLCNLFNNKGTVEVRLKHGSSDAEEITMYIKLLSRMFTNAVAKPCINNIEGSGDDFRNDFWNLQGVLRKVVKRKEPLNDEDYRLVNTAMNFLTNYFIKNDEHDAEGDAIAKYWKKHINMVHNYDQSLLKPKSAAPQQQQQQQPQAQEQAQPHSQSRLSDELPLEEPTVMSGGAVGKWMFAYGSNGLDQLRERVKHKGDFEHIPAYIQDYTRIFAGFSQKWNGGVASIFPRRCKRVYGTLVKLTDVEMARLDKFEGGYSRVVMSVNKQTKPSEPQMIYKSFVYVKNNNVYSDPPSKSYMAAIEKMLATTGGKTGKILINGVSHNQQLSIKGVWDGTEIHLR